MQQQLEDGTGKAVACRIHCHTRTHTPFSVRHERRAQYTFFSSASPLHACFIFLSSFGFSLIPSSLRIAFSSSHFLACPLAVALCAKVQRRALCSSPLYILLTPSLFQRIGQHVAQRFSPPGSSSVPYRVCPLLSASRPLLFPFLSRSSLFALFFVSLSASDSHCRARDVACSLGGCCLLSTCSALVSVLPAPFLFARS